MMTDQQQQHPVFEYRDKVLRDKGKFNTPGLDEMVLNRWDRFMEEGNFRYLGNITSVFLGARAPLLYRSCWEKKKKPKSFK